MRVQVRKLPPSRISTICLLLVLLAATPRLVSGQEPSLVVVISVDQMRGDFAALFDRFFGDSGFRRFLVEGRVWTRCYINHSATATGPGHATISTGLHPRQHGITGNSLCRYGGKECSYCTGSSQDTAMSAQRLAVPTLGDALKEKNAASKVISISHKDRAAILMGGRQADAVVWFSAAQGMFVTSGAYPRPAWLNEFNVRFPIARHRSARWETVIPENLQPAADEQPWEGTMSTGSRSFPHVLPREADESFYKDYLRSPTSVDDIFALARFTLKEEQMGKRNLFDLLFMSISTTDYVGHTFGPDSREVQEMYRHVDRRLGELVDYLDQWVGRSEYLLFLTSDHGIAPIPEYLQGAALQQRATVDAGRITEHQIKHSLDSTLGLLYPDEYQEAWIAMVSEPAVYLNHDLIRQTGAYPQEVRTAVVGVLRSLPGIGLAVTREDLADNRKPDDISEASWKVLSNGWNEEVSADVIFQPRRYWIIGKAPTSHGSWHDYDRHVPLMAIGWLSGKGISDVSADPADVVATLADIWNLNLTTKGQRLFKRSVHR